MKTVFWAAFIGTALMGNSSYDVHDALIVEVSKLRQKYEECRSGQNVIQGVDPREFNRIRAQYEKLLLENKKLQAQIAVLEKRYDDTHTKVANREQSDHSAAAGQAVPKSMNPPRENHPASEPAAPVVLHAPAIAAGPDNGRSVAKHPPVQILDKTAVDTAAKASPPAKTASFAYRIAGEGTIYDAPDGAPIRQWESGRSFTASVPQNGWIRISGYFVNRVWQPCSPEERFWIRECDAQRR